MYSHVLVICVEFTDAIAGKPAPTRFNVVHKICAHRKNCGSWLASEEAGPGAEGLQPLQLRHQIIQPINLLLRNVAGRQPIDVFGQFLHRAAFEHRAQRHVAL